jgi:hypothetical protein
MKHSWLLVFMLLGIIFLGAIPAGAASWAPSYPGPYYATPSWDQTLPAVLRFVVLTNFNKEAVLDRETGLVWEQAPSLYDTYPQAQFHCKNLIKGNRAGWRVPSLAELQTLYDPTVPSYPLLPLHHPFTLPTDFKYVWTEDFALPPHSTNEQALLNLYDRTYPGGSSEFNNYPAYTWCVRGPK